MRPHLRKKKFASENLNIRKELLVSLSEAKALLWTTWTKLTDEQIQNLSEFSEHLALYLVEIYLSWKLA